jgi:ArsR family transcriptional regulator, lead/cadmium/zinc/bismuth-responsive transcriptional repressor
MSSYSDIQGFRERLFGAELVSSLAETFKVLGDATRVRILDALSRRELCVGDIAQLLGLSESAVSHQLRLLRGARLVRQRRAGQMMFYALDDHHVIALFIQAREHVQERRADQAAFDKPAAADSFAAQPTPSGTDVKQRADAGQDAER